MQVEVLLALLTLAAVAGWAGWIAERRRRLRLRRDYESCRRAAQRDELTGAYRRGALEQAAELLGDGPLTCAFCDLNGLKAINDTHGHAEGDRLIREAVDALRTAGGEQGRLYRIGGDEFLLLLPYMGAKQERAVEERIAQAVTARQGGGRVSLSLAVGVVSLPDGGAADWPILFREAERRMYRDKQRQREKMEPTVGPGSDLPDGGRGDVK